VRTFRLLPDPPMICPQTAYWTGETDPHLTVKLTPEPVRLILPGTKLVIEVPRNTFGPELSDYIGHVNSNDGLLWKTGLALITSIQETNDSAVIVTVECRSFPWNSMIDADGFWRKTTTFPERELPELMPQNPIKIEIFAISPTLEIPNGSAFVLLNQSRLEEVPVVETAPCSS